MLKQLTENVCRHNAHMYPVAYIVYLRTLNAKLDRLEVEVAHFRDSLLQFMSGKQRLMVLCDQQNITVHTMQLLDEANREHKRLSHEIGRVNAVLNASQVNKTRELIAAYTAQLFVCNAGDDDDDDNVWNSYIPRSPLPMSIEQRQKLDALYILLCCSFVLAKRGSGSSATNRVPEDNGKRKMATTVILKKRIDKIIKDIGQYL